MKRIIAAALCLAIAGCATAPPNTPGAGHGDAHTPFIDLQGLDMARYHGDLEGCRGYARQIDPNRKMWEGILAGVIIGALTGAAVGGGRANIDYGATVGGGAYGGAAASGAVLDQQTLIANCMAGRGYRVLKGATQPTNTAAPSPYQGSLPAPAAPLYQPTSAPTPQQQPGSIIPGCGWVGHEWKCSR